MPLAARRRRGRPLVAPGRGDPASCTLVPRLQFRRPRRRGDPRARGLPGRVLPDDRGARGGEDGVLGRRNAYGVNDDPLLFARLCY